MKTLSKTGFSSLSDELFASFFTADKILTERIINTILGCDFNVDEIEACEVDRERFGYYHPFVLIDAHTKSGRCAIAVTHIGNGCEDDTGEIMNWILYHTALERRNIYPILISLDSTDSFRNEMYPVTLRIINDTQAHFAFAVVWTKMKSRREKLESLLKDLTATNSENIVDEEIRRIWMDSYEKSGLGEMEKVAYSMWMKSMENEIERLGVEIK